VVLENNPSLADARIPTLRTLGGSVVVTRCDHLCPAFFTSAVHEEPADTNACHPIDMHLFLLIAAPEGFSIVDWTTASAVISAALQNAGLAETSGKVRLVVSFFIVYAYLCVFTVARQCDSNCH
jgi:hypothetical protein